MSARGNGWSAGFMGLACLLLAFPPWDLWVLGLVAPALLAVCAMRAASGRAAFGRMCLLGVGVIAGGTYWLSETHVFNLAVVTVVEAPLVGLFGWLAHRCLRSDRSLFPALPVIWTTHEMVRMSWPETGYGWMLLGQGMAASPLLVQVADLGGVLAVSFVGASFATAVLASVTGHRGRLPAAIVVALAILYGAIRPTTLGTPEPGPVLAAIQPGFPQELKDRPTAVDVRWQACFELAEQIARADTPPDLLMFPETMWPWPMLVDGRESGDSPGSGRAGALDSSVAARLANDAQGHAPHIDALQALFGDARPHLLLGAFGLALVRAEHATDPWTARQVNTARLYAPDGEHLDRYDKHILIPGGEMIPFRGVLPEAVRAWLDRMVRDLAGFLPDLAPGPGPRPLQLQELPFGVTICFENAYGDYNRELVAQGARFLVNISNEGWFGVSPEFDHMELHSILRAVETRRALFRSTNTGVSCLVRPDGSRPTGADRLEVDGIDRGVSGSFTARVPLHDDSTLYVLWGDAVGWLCLAGTAALLVLRRRPSAP